MISAWNFAILLAVLLCGQKLSVLGLPTKNFVNEGSSECARLTTLPISLYGKCPVHKVTMDTGRYNPFAMILTGMEYPEFTGTTELTVAINRCRVSMRIECLEDQYCLVSYPGPEFKTSLKAAQIRFLINGELIAIEATQYENSNHQEIFRCKSVYKALNLTRSRYEVRVYMNQPFPGHNFEFIGGDLQRYRNGNSVYTTTTALPLVASTEAPQVAEIIPVGSTEIPVVNTEVPIVLPSEVPMESTEVPTVLPSEVPMESTEVPIVLPSEVPMESTEIPIVLPSEVPMESTEVPIVQSTENSQLATIVIILPEESTSPVVTTELPQATEIPMPASSEISIPASSEVSAPTASEISILASTEVPASASSEIPIIESTEVPAPTSSEILAPASTEVPAPTSSEILAPASSEILTPAATEIPIPANSEIPIAETTEFPVHLITEQMLINETIGPISSTLPSVNTADVISEAGGVDRFVARPAITRSGPETILIDEDPTLVEASNNRADSNNNSQVNANTNSQVNVSSNGQVDSRQGFSDLIEEEMPEGVAFVRKNRVWKSRDGRFYFIDMILRTKVSVPSSV